MLVRLTGALLVALALLAAPSAGAAAKLSRAAQQVYGDYRNDAAIQPCDHTVADYRRTLREITPAIEEQSPAFRPAVEAALREREGSKSGCASKGETSPAKPAPPATTGRGTSKPVAPPAPTAAPVAPAVPQAKPAPAPATATAAPVPTAAPATSATPVPTATPAPPAATATPAAAPAEPVLLDRPHHGTPTGLVIALGLLALALLAAALAALASRLGWGGERLAGARHAWGEAGYRAAGTWADFVDWLRVGGGPHRL